MVDCWNWKTNLIWHWLLIHKSETKFHRTKDKKNMLKEMDFYHLRKIFRTNIKKHLLDTGLNALKTTSKRVVHKVADATCEFIGNKMAG